MIIVVGVVLVSVVVVVVVVIVCLVVVVVVVVLIVVVIVFALVIMFVLVLANGSGVVHSINATLWSVVLHPQRHGHHSVLRGASPNHSLLR